MQIETLKVKNFRSLRDVEIKDIGPLAVFLGKNGVGKSTLFDVFGFLRDCLSTNVVSALQARGGFHEVISRGQEGEIEFVIQFRPDNDDPQKKRAPLHTYELHIALGEESGQPEVAFEQLRYRRGAHGRPYQPVDFHYGVGSAEDESQSKSNYTLESKNVLAVRVLGHMAQHPPTIAFRKLLEDWFVSDFKIDAARKTEDIAYHEQLSRSGDNLANVTQYISEQHPAIFATLLDRMRERIPGISTVTAKPAEDGRILLKFGSEQFKDPFAARFVSDGTLRMFAYEVMLANPKKHSLLCIEEPENQLYAEMLQILAEEFREYAHGTREVPGRQVFVSTHSPDFVNALNPKEVFFIDKGGDGFSTVRHLLDDALIVRMVEEGDMLGYMWRTGDLDKREDGQ